MNQTVDRELVWLGGIGAVLLGLIAGVESAGLVGALFASGHPMMLSFPAAAATLGHLPGHLGPSAWPTVDRHWLPETMTAPLALGSLVALAFAALAAWGLARLARPLTGDCARFARAGDLRPLWMRSGRSLGIPLGRHHGRELVGEANASVALCGPSQVGKSLAAVVRAILKWDGCLIVLSIKEELLRYTLDAREQRGEVKIFDPTRQTAYRAQAWSPVAASSTWTEARAIAAGLLQIGQEADRYDREPHWRRTAARYLAPLLLAANQTGLTMRTVLSWIDLFERDDLRKILNTSSDPDSAHALENLESLWKTDHRYQGSVIGTLSTALDAWQEPTIAEATTLPDITPEWLCEGSNTLYIVAPASQQRRLQNLFGGLLVHMIDGALGIAARQPTGRLSPPLLCALDEICNAAPLPTLGEYASSGAGQGVLLLSVIQDYSQAIDTWGRERAATIISNHRGKLFWSGIADPATFEYVDHLLGREERERQSRTRQAFGGTSTTRATELRPLAPPHRLRQAKFGTALLVYGQLPPVWTEQRLFFDDPQLRALVPAELRTGTAVMRARAPGSGVGRMPVELIRAPLALLAAIALGGCGAISAQHATTGDRGGSDLGQTIATAPTAAATGSTTATQSAPTTASPPPESIRLPPPPAATAPRSRAILRVARRFANAYLLYQAGRDPGPVQQTIRETCARSFAQLLLSQPVNIPATQRQSVASQRSALGSLTYTGSASLGPGPRVQIVIAHYHAIARPNVVAQLTIELAGSGGRWRVDSLR